MDHWKTIEAMVRKAAWEESKLPVPPPMSVPRPLYRGSKETSLWGLDREIFSSDSPRGREAGWFPPSPNKVLVLMECCSGPLREAGLTADTKKGWAFLDKVVKRLRADPWVLDAGWESYNAAIAYVWVKPLMAA